MTRPHTTGLEGPQLGPDAHSWGGNVASVHGRPERNCCGPQLWLDVCGSRSFEATISSCSRLSVNGSASDVPTASGDRGRKAYMSC